MSQEQNIQTFEFRGQPFVVTEGIFFGMDEDLYHAIPALSSTGFKNLLMSAPDFYFNSWLNPMREEDAEDAEASEWRRFGKAAHFRVLEGRADFYNNYCVEFLAPEGCLKTTDDMKAYLTETGFDMKGTSKFKKPDWAQAVKFKNPEALIFDIEQEKYARETMGKIQLSERELRRIEIAAAMIENHKDLRHYFTGGFPEVTVIWFADGLWYKARFDYLKPRAIVDLKTFTNKSNKPIDAAIYQAMAGHKYHIQAVHYSLGAKKAVGFAQQGIVTTMQSRYTEPQRAATLKAFLAALASNTEGHDFYFAFQKKGGAPLARGKKFPKNTLMWGAAEASIEQAVGLYKQYFEAFGSEIWVDTEPTSDFEDGGFPAYATEL